MHRLGCFVTEEEETGITLIVNVYPFPQSNPRLGLVKFGKVYLQAADIMKAAPAHLSDLVRETQLCTSSKKHSKTNI